MSESLTELLGHLEARRSVMALQLKAPGPNPEQLDRMLTIAARVPDHGKLAPWRFVVVEGDARAALAQKLNALRKVAEPDVSDERLAKDRAILATAPVTVCVVGTARQHPKIPVSEQVLSAGAACLNMLHAAHALGFRAQWLTGWAAYDATAKAALGLTGNEAIAGFIHIGSNDEPQADRDRPDVAALTQRWSPAD